MRINLDKMDIYKFVVCVLAFILVFCFIFMLQTKSVINMQNKLLAQYIDQKPITQPIKTIKTTTPTTYPGY